MANPDLSVVCGVRDGGAAMEASLRSVLEQTDVDLELIVVDDGSEDATPEVLRSLAEADERVRVARQEKEGLTAALRRGCGLARGEFIARHDAGDFSLPGRLAAELALARQDAEASLVSCGTEFVGPGGEELYEIVQPDHEATLALRPTPGRALRGPSHHGATLFRRTAYEEAGGYRQEFYFAQDLDLWVRLARSGPHRVVERVLYRAVFSTSSISLRHRSRQERLAAIIREGAERRERGLSEDDLLAQAREIRPDGHCGSDKSDLADGFYFIGACLARRRDRRAARYLREAVRRRPTHARAIASLVREGLRAAGMWPGGRTPAAGDADLDQARHARGV